MSSFEHHELNWTEVARRSLLVAGFACAAALGGCSADLGRFDGPSAGLSGDSGRGRQAPIPYEPLRRNAGAPIAPLNEAEQAMLPPPNPGPVRQAGLPEPIYRDQEPRRQPEPLRREPSGQSRAAPVSMAPSANQPAAAAQAGGRTIDVQPGDTLFGLSKQHKVAISELMSANNLQNPTIRPGQKLVIPSGGRRAVPPRRNEQVAAAPAGGQTPAAQPAPTRVAAGAPAAPARPAPEPAAADTPAPTDWNGSHTVGPRDSLYALAKQYKVKVGDLQSVNNITDPAKLRAGTVLKVPGAAGSATVTAASERPVAAAKSPEPALQPAPLVPASTPSSGAPRPTIINAESRTSPAERVAAVTPKSPTANDATPEASAKADSQPKATPAAAGPIKFRWPAKGKVIANFGPRGDNTHNDGINILVPQGTDVLAAETGTVAYAGSELKGYGNLLLIRHEGNWVTAYAHNETLMVKRGDKVTRGQAIAKAGKTGAVDQPQVHFELRQGSKPVDPTPHLEK